jgi:hypothetical protein
MAAASGQWAARPAGQGQASGGDMFVSGEDSAGNDPWSKPWKHWDPPGADKRGTGDGSGARGCRMCAVPSCRRPHTLWPSALALALPPGAPQVGGAASPSSSRSAPQVMRGAFHLFDEEPARAGMHGHISPLLNPVVSCRCAPLAGAPCRACKQRGSSPATRSCMSMTFLRPGCVKCALDLAQGVEEI